MSQTQEALVSELGRRETAKDRVRRALLSAGSRGLTNIELSDIALRFGARLFELRNEGFIVEKRAQDGGIVRYWLRPQDRLF